ncbi:-Golgi reassembly-stacking protein 1 [Babesia bigemina]|uniref:-Golgi reassembly-stacking protein 1 n=1 Tax=Babesia bigemina TaxID=5866 RepID=A0A061DAH5_BABBI|nr:-Golgi reassembly-stacking protein 1 [Babesia bigemina]CDR97553.1 -Golgi reassembly-stacking protein 1 [Babesia bigemina]|eukprot:XP_012769739.1 -Golgi reassembly-stacking protein 1 [Babesia bigemina]
MGGNTSRVIPTGGLRVHRVYPNGPAEDVGFEIFFDYIMEADHNSYSDDSDETLMSFTSYISSKENQEISLNVYNARKKSLRIVKMTPRKWDGVGLLGLSVRFAEFTAMDEGAHVLKVHEGSPASKAGLIPITDYLLATNLQLFVDSDCVRVHVGERINEEVPLYVYNSITESIRKTVITPRNDWGGAGTLGCDLANGYIHRIPLVKGIYNVPSEAPSADYNDGSGELTLDLSTAGSTVETASNIVTEGQCNVISLSIDSSVTEDEESPEEPYLPPSIATVQNNSSLMENDEHDSSNSEESDSESSDSDSSDDGKETPKAEKA